MRNTRSKIWRRSLNKRSLAKKLHKYSMFHSNSVVSFSSKIFHKTLKAVHDPRKKRKKNFGSFSRIWLTCLKTSKPLVTPLVYSFHWLRNDKKMRHPWSYWQILNKYPTPLFFLIHFMPLVSFYTPFSGCIERE